MAAQSFKVGEAPWEVASNTSAAPQAFKVGEAPWEKAPSDEPTMQPGESLRDVANRVNAYNDAKAPAATPGMNEGSAKIMGFGQGALAGYLPQLQAGTQKSVFSLMNHLTGQHVQPDEYVKARDSNIANLEKLKAAYPSDYSGGEAAGLIGSAAVTPFPGLKALPAGGGLVGSVLRGGTRGALAGAQYAAVANPGDETGKVNPLQLDERGEAMKEGAKKGFMFGSIAEPVTQGIKGLGGKLQNLEENSAVKATGAMLKDFRALEGKEKTNEFGRFLRDSGLVKAGDDVGSVAEKAAALREKAGNDLNEIYSTAKAKADAAIKSGAASPEALKNLQDKWATSGFNPVRDKEELMSIAQKELGNEVGKRPALNKLSAYLDELALEHGDKVVDLKTANEIKSAVDRSINYSRNPMQPEPDFETAAKKTRAFISGKIDQEIDMLGNLSGDKGLLNKLKETNKTYGFSKAAENHATDYAQRMKANSSAGLTDKIAAGAGGLVGGAAVAATGDHDPVHNLGAAGIAGLGSGLLNHYGKQYGSGLISAGAGNMAAGLNSAAPMIQNIPQSTLIRAGVGKGLLNKKKDK